MGAHRWLGLGDALRSLMMFFAGLLVVYVISPFPDHLGAGAIVALIAGVSAAFLVGTVVHELGHVLAIRLAGQRPTVIHLLGPPDRVAFHVGAVRVGVGIKPGGEVEYPGNGLSAAQSAVIAAAGPAADLVIAPLVLVLPVARWAAVILAVMIAAPGARQPHPGESRGRFAQRRR